MRRVISRCSGGLPASTVSSRSNRERPTRASHTRARTGPSGSAVCTSSANRMRSRAAVTGRSRVVRGSQVSCCAPRPSSHWCDASA